VQGWKGFPRITKQGQKLWHESQAKAYCKSFCKRVKMQSRIIPVLMKTMLVKTNASYYYLVANYLYGQQLLSLANFIIVI
jgi:hypothetical protein